MENLMSWYNHKLEDAEFYRLGVMALVLLVQMSIIVPATLLAISMNGGSSLNLLLVQVFHLAFWYHL